MILDHESIGIDTREKDREKAPIKGDNRIENLERVVNKTILIVDDEPDIISSCSEAFKSENKSEDYKVNYKVISTSNADEALEKFRKGGIDLILSDYNMPDKNGLELLQEVREISNKENKPYTGFVLMTGHSSNEIAVGTIRGKGDNYLSKPFKIKELIEQVKNTLQRVEEERKKEEEICKLREMATLDAGTGLLNRGQYKLSLQKAIEHAEENNGYVGIIAVDLQNFKPVNDMMGHHVGDKMIKQTADFLNGTSKADRNETAYSFLKRSARSGEVVWLRTGGDEYLGIFMGGKDKGDALKGYAKRLYEEANKFATEQNKNIGENIDFALNIGVDYGKDNFHKLAMHAEDVVYLQKALSKARNGSKEKESEVLSKLEFPAGLNNPSDLPLDSLFYNPENVMQYKLARELNLGR